MWVRGLKLCFFFLSFQPLHVAPYVGAWIETCESCRYDAWKGSHPMWVRGLKQRVVVAAAIGGSRTLCGCVD